MTGGGALVNRELERKYEAVAYAAQANALSHPRHLATVATLFGLAPPAVATCRVLEVGCSDGANLLPMAAALPHARFIGCDLSGSAIAAARQAANELGLANITFLQQDLATLTDDPAAFDYIIAHGVYSWVPAPVRDALLALAAHRLARNGVLFVSYNVYPGCHVREAAWRILHHHVDRIADPRAQLDAARALAALLAEPGVTQTDTDALLRQEFGKLAAKDDSALFHDDLALPNDPVYFHEFAAHLARHGLTFLAEAKLSMMTAAGLASRMQQFLGGMDRLAREQYLDFARMRRFRQSLVCRADAIAAGSESATRVTGMHVAASMSLIRAAAEGKAFAEESGAADVNLRVARRVLQWLLSEAPRIVPFAEIAAWQRDHAGNDDAAARPLPALLAEACYAGTVELYTHPPALAAVAAERPVASPVVRWQARRQPSVTNLRHETLRIDDPFALALLVLLDGTRTRGDLVAAMESHLPQGERARTGERVATYLSHFAMHGLLAA
ncbi:MAG: class I SAM-dependent methyltransferase [Casimicrobiaceae bacterium]